MVATPPDAVLGVHIAAGTLWFASVLRGGEFVDDRIDRLKVAFDLGEERALSEAEESIQDLLGRLQPVAVALLKPGAGQNQPKPSDTLRRGQVEGALLIACHRSGAGVELVTHNAVEKIVGKRPSGAEYCTLAAALLSCKRPNQWSNRAPAYGAGLAVAGYEGPS